LRTQGLESFDRVGGDAVVESGTQAASREDVDFALECLREPHFYADKLEETNVRFGVEIDQHVDVGTRNRIAARDASKDRSVGDAGAE